MGKLMRNKRRREETGGGDKYETVGKQTSYNRLKARIISIKLDYTFMVDHIKYRQT